MDDSRFVMPNVIHGRQHPAVVAVIFDAGDHLWVASLTDQVHIHAGIVSQNIPAAVLCLDAQLAQRRLHAELSFLLGCLRFVEHLHFLLAVIVKSIAELLCGEDSRLCRVGLLVPRGHE